MNCGWCGMCVASRHGPILAASVSTVSQDTWKRSLAFPCVTPMQEYHVDQSGPEDFPNATTVLYCVELGSCLPGKGGLHRSHDYLGTRENVAHALLSSSPIVF